MFGRRTRLESDILLYTHYDGYEVFRIKKNIYFVATWMGEETGEETRRVQCSVARI